MDKEKRLELFNGELATITEDDVRNFAKYVIEHADDYFFEMPASTTGKYHPYYSLGDGGLVRHTRAVVYFLNELVRSQLFDINDHQRNLLVLAAIAHDIKKKGDGSGQHTVKEHPKYASEYLKECYANNMAKKSVEFPIDDIYYVCSAVESHMGVWGDKKPSSEHEKVLHIADLLASRKDVDVKFISEGLKTPTVPIFENVQINNDENVEPNKFVFPFGKFRGKTIEEVDAIDSTYLDWAETNMTYNPQVMETIKKYKENKK